MSKIDIEFTDEDTVKFRNNFNFEFIPELSPISVEANLTLLNSPLLVSSNINTQYFIVGLFLYSFPNFP